MSTVKVTLSLPVSSSVSVADFHRAHAVRQPTGRTEPQARLDPALDRASDGKIAVGGRVELDGHRRPLRSPLSRPAK